MSVLLEFYKQIGLNPSFVKDLESIELKKMNFVKLDLKLMILL